jgi:hypothetical protein
MRRAIQFMLRLYPAPWRERYRGEFEALLEQMRPGWRDVFDVLRGAVKMQIVGSILGYDCDLWRSGHPDRRCILVHNSCQV